LAYVLTMSSSMWVCRRSVNI